MRSEMNLYLPGDMIPGYGRVDTNHVGAPWVCTVDGNLAFGVVHVVNGGLHDAKTGALLSNEEVDSRVGNMSFDYDDRWQSRHPRPRRELDAISQSIMDRPGFVAGKPWTWWRRKWCGFWFWWRWSRWNPTVVRHRGETA
jgi:hypothetical protein